MVPNKLLFAIVLAGFALAPSAVSRFSFDAEEASSPAHRRGFCTVENVEGTWYFPDGTTDHCTPDGALLPAPFSPDWNPYTQPNPNLPGGVEPCAYFIGRDTESGRGILFAFYNEPPDGSAYPNASDLVDGDSVPVHGQDEETDAAPVPVVVEGVEAAAALDHKERVLLAAGRVGAYASVLGGIFGAAVALTEPGSPVMICGVAVPLEDVRGMVSALDGLGEFIPQEFRYRLGG